MPGHVSWKADVLEIITRLGDTLVLGIWTAEEISELDQHNRVPSVNECTCGMKTASPQEPRNGDPPTQHHESTPGQADSMTLTSRRMNSIPSDIYLDCMVRIW